MQCRYQRLFGGLFVETLDSEEEKTCCSVRCWIFALDRINVEWSEIENLKNETKSLSTNLQHVSGSLNKEFLVKLTEHTSNCYVSWEERLWRHLISDLDPLMLQKECRSARGEAPPYKMAFKVHSSAQNHCFFCRGGLIVIKGEGVIKIRRIVQGVGN